MHSLNNQSNQDGYQVTNRWVVYTQYKNARQEMIQNPDGMEWNGVRFSQATLSGRQFKTYDISAFFLTVGI